MPYNLKILSGGTLFKGVSYYFYFFLFERGEVGGIEDAFIYFNDIAGAPLDIQVGQFQVSDPLFKRELRLTFADYLIYRTKPGDSLAVARIETHLSGLDLEAEVESTFGSLSGNSPASSES